VFNLLAKNWLVAKDVIWKPVAVEGKPVAESVEVVVPVTNASPLVSIATTSHRVDAIAGEISGICGRKGESATGVEFGQKAVGSRRRRLECSSGRRKIAGSGGAGDIGLSAHIDCNSSGIIAAISAEIRVHRSTCDCGTGIAGFSLATKTSVGPPA